MDWTDIDDDLILKCVNGHDRCYLGPDPDCPYCERRRRGPVDVGDELHQILGEALNVAKAAR